MKPRLSQRFWFALRLLVSVGLVAWLVWQIDWRLVWQAILQVSWVTFALLVGGLLLNRLLAFYRFWLLLNLEGAKFRLRTIVRLSFVAVFVSNFLPSTVGGDVTKVGWLASRGFSAWRATFWVLLDRLSNMLAVFLLLPSLFLLPDVRGVIARWTGGREPGGSFALLAFAILVILAGGGLALLQKPASSGPDTRNPEAGGRLPGGRAIWKALRSRTRTFSLLAGISLVSFIPFLLGIWLTANDLGMAVTLGQVTAIYAVIYWVTLIPISLNGLGVQEVSTVYLYQSLGAAESAAVALAVLLRFAILFTTLPGALWLGRGVSAGEPPREGAAG